MSLFRQKPPIDLVLQFLATATLTSIHDHRTFSRESINLPSFSTLLPLLQPYYTPSRDSYTNRELTPSLAITILRQILKEHGRRIVSTVSQRQTWYKMISLDEDKTVVLTFE
jgi:hypothetical protein